MLSCVHAYAGVAQLAEHQLPKLNVEGSSPFARFLNDAWSIKPKSSHDLEAYSELAMDM